MKKKIINTLIVSTAVGSLWSMNVGAGTTLVYGDLSGDGEVTAEDASLALQKSLDMDYKLPIESEYPDLYLSIADVDNSGNIDAADASIILEKALDRDYVMPAEQKSPVTGGDETESTTEATTEATTQTTTETTTEGTTEAVTYNSDIVLSDNNITVNGKTDNNGGVDIYNSDNYIVITNGGSYNITGSLTDGQIVVNSDTDVELNLNGVSVTNSKGPSIYGLNGDIDISAKKGTTNTLTDGAPTEVDEDGEPDACIYSSDGLKLKGTGSLTINGNYANGISGKDEVIIQKLNLTVNSVSNAVKAKDELTVTSGTLNLTSTDGDGLRCTKGNIIINDGTITIKAKDNGIFAKAGNIEINGGTIEIDTDTSSADTDNYNYDGIHTKVGTVSINGGSVTVVSYCDGIQSAGDLTITNSPTVNVTTTGVIKSTTSGGGFGGWQNNQTADISAKGIKSDTNIVISGGNITVNSTDDSLHSNSCITLENATITASTGDDGVHADGTLTINDGCNITVEKSYEGIEAEKIYINGGEIHINADDDSINAAGGNDSSSGGGFGSTADGYIEINGGYIFCQNTNDGDGIDSNGKIIVNGGTLLVNGPTSSDNGAIDYGDKSSDYMAYNAGTIIAVGSSGMAAYPSSKQSNGYTLYYTTGSSSNKGFGGWGGSWGNSSSSAISAGTLLTLVDSSGNVVMAFTPSRTTQSAVFSSDSIKSGETYTLYKGGTYSGTLNSDGYAYGGTVTGGTKLASAKVSSKLTSMS